MRQLVLLVVLLFIALLVYLTASMVKRHGLNAGGILSIVVIAILAIGVVGSLLHNPRN
jgi:uncharacterized BrkB/YihY/UPF0761 family membrane protein